MTLQEISRNCRTGKLLRFLLNPPPLSTVPLRPSGFAARLARHPVDLVTHLGMVRANASYAAYVGASARSKSLKQCADIVRKFYPELPQ